jgi:hypothetical protein
MEEVYESGFMSAWEMEGSRRWNFKSIATAFFRLWSGEYVALGEPWLEGLNWRTSPLPVVSVP